MTTKQIMQHPGALYKLKYSDLSLGDSPTWVVVRDSRNTLAIEWEEERVLMTEPTKSWETVDAEWIEASNKDYHELIDRIFAMISVYRIHR